MTNGGGHPPKEDKGKKPRKGEKKPPGRKAGAVKK